jgi:phosphoglycolate phosphatase-like HAD superfamily hydrolase
MKNIIFLDFDGVLFNTVKEAYAIAMISTKRSDTIKNIDFSSEHYQNFLKYRYLVSPAWNYKYILELLECKENINFEDSYNLLCNKACKSDYIDFENSFFETRQYLKKIDFAKWLKMNEPYPFLNTIKEYLIEKNDKFIIVTTKDKETIQKLLKINGINFNKESIYDKNDFEKYNNKANIITVLIDTYNIDNAIFIDDSIEHLEKCKHIKTLELYQANWGYISKEASIALSNEMIFNKIKELIG